MLKIEGRICRVPGDPKIQGPGKKKKEERGEWYYIRKMIIYVYIRSSHIIKKMVIISWLVYGPP